MARGRAFSCLFFYYSSKHATRPLDASLADRFFTKEAIIGAPAAKSVAKGAPAKSANIRADFCHKWLNSLYMQWNSPIRLFMAVSNKKRILLIVLEGIGRICRLQASRAAGKEPHRSFLWKKKRNSKMRQAWKKLTQKFEEKREDLLLVGIAVLPLIGLLRILSRSLSFFSFGKVLPILSSLLFPLCCALVFFSPKFNQSLKFFFLRFIKTYIGQKILFTAMVLEIFFRSL